MEANNLKEIRKDRGITQEELADRAGLSQQQITNIERGKTALKVYVAKQIAAILECHWTELFDNDPMLRTRRKIADSVRGLSEDQIELAMRIINSLNPEDESERSDAA